MFIYRLVIEKRENIKQSTVFESSPQESWEARKNCDGSQRDEDVGRNLSLNPHWIPPHLTVCSVG